MKDAYYFPHFSGARNDRRIKRLRKQLGVEAYGLYFMTLEVLRDQKDFTYPVDDLDLLADDFNTSCEKLDVVIRAEGLFDFTPDGRFFSTNLIKYLEPYIARKEKARLAAQKRWGRGQGMLEECSSTTQAMQSKVKKSKRKKVEDIKEKSAHFNSDLFSSTWNDYLDMRISIKKKATDKAQVIALNKLNDYDTDTAIKMLEQSIFNSWQGIFELKGDFNVRGQKAGHGAVSRTDQKKAYSTDGEY